MVEAHRFQVRVDQPARGAPEVERDEPTPIRRISYHCPRGGHEFAVPFAAATDVDVEIPDVWRCRHHGVDCRQVDRADAPLPPMPYRDRKRDGDGRTHWDRVLERRSIPELYALLQERLALMGHGSQLEPLESTSSRTGPIRR